MAFTSVIFKEKIWLFQWPEVPKGPKILPSQQLGAAVAPWPGATGLLASVTADDMAHKGKFLHFYILNLTHWTPSESLPINASTYSIFYKYLW